MASAASSNEQPKAGELNGLPLYHRFSKHGVESSAQSKDQPIIGELNGLPLYHAGGAEAPDTEAKPLPSPDEKPVAETMPQHEDRQAIQARKRRKLQIICIVNAVIVYFALMAGQAVWIYFYVKTSVHPDPRRFINSKLVRWRAYVAFMYVFGGMYSCLNLSLWWSVAIDAIFKCKYREEFGTRSNLLFCLLFPLFAVWMVIYPAFGPLIILPPVRRRAFAHECDSWAAQVVLDGRSYKDPGYVANTAIFTTSQDTSPLFSFDLIQTDPSFASFHFRQFDALESAMDSTLVPVVRSITYDLVKQSFNGTCAISDGSDTPCLNGSFDLVDFALNLNYTLPGRSNVESRSRSELPGWKVYGGLPTFTLRSLGLDGMLGEPVLKTATTAAGDCTRLKVCLASSPDTNANGPVGPDTLVPLGLMLASHANYSLECTKPPKRKK